MRNKPVIGFEFNSVQAMIIILARYSYASIIIDLE